MKQLDITGERYGKLTAIRRIPSQSPSRWVLKCDCGTQTTALLCNLRSGQVKSCGCAGSRQAIGQKSLKHGHSVGFRKSRTAASWHNAKTRCFNKANAKYPEYGGRGITMCKEWTEDFQAFLRDMGECPDGHTLDRIDVNGNYEPANCRWATLAIQSTNKRNSIRAGDMPLKTFASSVGIDYKRLHYRIRKYGETPQRAAEWFLTSRTSAQNNKHEGLDSEK